MMTRLASLLNASVPRCLLASQVLYLGLVAGNAQDVAGPTDPVVVNRRAPDVEPPRLEPLFSDPPTDTEIWHARIFAEPVIPASGPVSADENRALVRAFMTFRARPNNEDV